MNSLNPLVMARYIRLVSTLSTVVSCTLVALPARKSACDSAYVFHRTRTHHVCFSRSSMLSIHPNNHSAECLF